MSVNKEPEEPIDISLVPVYFFMVAFVTVCGFMMCAGVDTGINCLVASIFLILGVGLFILLKIRYIKAYKKYEEDLKNYNPVTYKMYPSAPTPKPDLYTSSIIIKTVPVYSEPEEDEDEEDEEQKKRMEYEEELREQEIREYEEEMERIDEEILEQQEKEDEERREREEDYWLNGPGNEYYSHETHHVEDPSYFENHPDENRYY